MSACGLLDATSSDGWSAGTLQLFVTKTSKMNVPNSLVYITNVGSPEQCVNGKKSLRLSLSLRLQTPCHCGDSSRRHLAAEVVQFLAGFVRV